MAHIYVVFLLFPCWLGIPDRCIDNFEKLKKQYNRLTWNIYYITYEESRAAGVNHIVIIAIIDAESRFKANAVSSSGAIGLMQVMPFHFRSSYFGFEPRHNINAGVNLFSKYKRMANENLVLALRNYERGPRGKGCNIKYTARIIKNILTYYEID